MRAVLRTTDGRGAEFARVLLHPTVELVVAEEVRVADLSGSLIPLSQLAEIRVEENTPVSEGQVLAVLEV